MAARCAGGSNRKDAAIKALVGDDCIDVKPALKLLYDYCLERGAYVERETFEGICEFPKCSRFWAKDPDFDMRLLEFYYDALEMQTPWKFWENRSVRTVQDLAWPDGDRPDFEVPGVAHDARWDAVTQAMQVQAAMRRLGLSRDQDVEFSSWKGNDLAKSAAERYWTPEDEQYLLEFRYGGMGSTPRTNIQSDDSRRERQTRRRWYYSRGLTRC